MVSMMGCSTARLGSVVVEIAAAAVASVKRILRTVFSPSGFLAPCVNV
jgi:hypothetical protein